MVAYNFKAKFSDAIVTGSKIHTIRDERKDGRHAKAGDRLQLYVGMRTKNCVLLESPLCWQVFEIVVCSGNQMVFINDRRLTPIEVDLLIKGDGFKVAEEFWDFFPTANVKHLICWQKVEWLKRFIKVGNHE